MGSLGGAARPSAKVQDEAASWFGRMRGPGRDRLRPAFEKWHADPQHAQAYAQVEAMWRTSGGLAHTEMGRNRQLPPRRRSLFQIPLARPAFAMIFLAAVAGLAFALLGAPTSVPTMVAQASPLATRVGEIRSVRLADGSTVTLDTDSAVDVRLSDAAREVRVIRGRARFEVARDDQRPFRVEAGGRSISAGATTFDVALVPQGWQVSMLRGEANVTGTAPADIAGPGTRLVAGECLLGGDPKPRVEKLPQGSDRWVTGMLSFDGTPLAEVLEQTNRYSSTKIRLGAPGLGSLRVTGAFRPLPVKGLAATLAAAFDLQVEERPGGDLLLRKR